MIKSASITWWNGDQPRATGRIRNDSHFHAIVWDVATGKAMWRKNGLRSDILISGDGKTMFAEEIPAAQVICDPETGKVIRRFKFPEECVAVSYDGKVGIFDKNREKYLLRDLVTGQIIVNVGKFRQSDIQTLTITRDNRRVLLGTEEGKVLIFDVRLGKVIAQFVRHYSSIRGIAISPNSKWIASADMKEVCVWQMPQTGDQSAPIETVRLEAKLK